MARQADAGYLYDALRRLDRLLERVQLLHHLQRFFADCARGWHRGEIHSAEHDREIS